MTKSNLRIIKTAGAIKFMEGDWLTSDCDIICIQVNTTRTRLSRNLSLIKEKYINVFKECVDFKEKNIDSLGQTLFIKENDKIIASMFTQKNNGKKLITDYKAFESCLLSVSWFSFANRMSVSFPFKTGCGKDGQADWHIVQKIITKYFDNRELQCLIYY